MSPVGLHYAVEAFRIAEVGRLRNSGTVLESLGDGNAGPLTHARDTVAPHSERIGVGPIFSATAISGWSVGLLRGDQCGYTPAEVQRRPPGAASAGGRAAATLGLAANGLEQYSGGFFDSALMGDGYG